MSQLSGYDSEAVGFDNISQEATLTKSSGSQTTEFKESGAESQTNLTKSMGCMVHPDDLREAPIKEYPQGLNEFLRKVVPAMMEQLDQNDNEFVTDSSDSDEEESLTAKLLQEIKLKDGSGDHQSSILGITWSSTGNSLAVSIGQMHHESWCQNCGTIKVFTLKRSEERFVHAIDVSEKNCVTVLKYHPSVAALLAYGTTSGEVVICNLRNGTLDEGTLLASPSGCHGSRRLTALYWADMPLANRFLLMQINDKGKRRGAADQVLFSAGSDGTLNVWQVNVSQKTFENIVCYTVCGTQKLTPELTCFDFIKGSPLRPVTEKIPVDIFVVGSKTGKLFLCKIEANQLGDILDPVYDVLEGHSTCVLDVAFNLQRPGVFVSISMDSELRIYDVNQGSPLKVVFLDVPISCMSWLSLPGIVLGLSGCEELLRVYNVYSESPISVNGFAGTGTVSCVAVNQSGSCRIAAGDDSGTVRVWDFPIRRIKFSTLLDF